MALESTFYGLPVEPVTGFVASGVASGETQLHSACLFHNKLSLYIIMEQTRKSAPLSCSLL